MAVAADSPPLAEHGLTGFKYFQRLAPLLGRLHEVGCARDTAGDRKRGHS
jgi:hypothetical protein